MRANFSLETMLVLRAHFSSTEKKRAVNPELYTQGRYALGMKGNSKHSQMKEHQEDVEPADLP